MSREFDYSAMRNDASQNDEIHPLSNPELENLLSKPIVLAQLNTEKKIDKVEPAPQPGAAKLDQPPAPKPALPAPLDAAVPPGARAPIEGPVPPGARAPLDARENIRPGDDVFQLSSGHKVIGSKGDYRITDLDGNLVRIFPNGLEAKGKVKSNTKDQDGVSTIKFENGSTVIYAPSGRLTISGADGKSSSMTLQKVPSLSLPQPFFRSQGRNQQI